MRDTTPEGQLRHQSEIRHSQTELFELQSDKSRLKRKQDDLTIEIRRLRSELSHLGASLEEKMAAERSLAREIELADDVIMRTKKHMDSL